MAYQFHKKMQHMHVINVGCCEWHYALLVVGAGQKLR